MQLCFSAALHADQEKVRKKKKKQVKSESKLQNGIIAVQCAAIVGLLAYLKYGVNYGGGKAAQSAHGLSKSTPQSAVGSAVGMASRENNGGESKGDKNCSSIANQALAALFVWDRDMVVSLLIKLGADNITALNDNKQTVLYSIPITSSLLEIFKIEEAILILKITKVIQYCIKKCAP